eukprot:4351355-Amphidinium_carterae.1
MRLSVQLMFHTLEAWNSPCDPANPGDDGVDYSKSFIVDKDLLAKREHQTCAAHIVVPPVVSRCTWLAARSEIELQELDQTNNKPLLRQ